MSDTLPLRDCWPVDRNGPLPSFLLPDEFIESAFFQTMTAAWSCSSPDMRRSLKMHLKRTAPKARRVTLASADIAERDRLLAVTVCNEPLSRARLSEFVVVSEAAYQRFGRSRGRTRSFEPHLSLPDLLWLVYTNDPALAEIVDWTKTAATDRNDLGPGYYLTGPSIAGTDGPTPPEVSTREFALAILLFGAVLPPTDMFELYGAAARLGCSAFGEFSETSMPEVAVPDKPAGPESIAKLARPRMRAGVPLEHVPSPAAPAEVEALAWRVVAADEFHASSAAAAEAAFAAGVAAVLAQSEIEYAASVASLTGAREAARVAREVHGEGRQRLSDLRDEAHEAVGLERGAAVDEEFSPAELATGLREAGAIAAILRHDVDEALLSSWRCELAGPLGLADFEKLASRHAAASELRRAEGEFRAAAATFVGAGRAAAEIASWLKELEADEVAALLSDMEDASWTPAAAILMRTSVERRGDAVPGRSRDMLLHAPNIRRRRALLRFCDPTSSAFDNDPDVRRVLAAERLRDVIAFGPLAQITDPASGLSDVNLVGRTIVSLAELITGHLELLAAGSELRFLLQRPSGSTERAAAFKAFARTPSQMSGNYRRLRDWAREEFVLPVAAGASIDRKAAADFLRRLEQGVVADEVVAAVETQKLGAPIESRHRLQLDRYLGQAAQLLKGALAEGAARTGKREQDLRRDFQRLHGQLRTGGDEGSVAWLESQVATVVAGATAPQDGPTLLGDTVAVDRRRWSESDTLWAHSYLDLAEFYTDEELVLVDIAAAALRWRYVGRAPTLEDVVDDLVERGSFASALSAIEDAPDGENLASRVRAAAQPLVRMVQDRLSEFEARFGAELIERSQLAREVAASLDACDLDAANDQCDLLELELTEAIERAVHEAGEEEASHRREELLRLLLLADAVVDEGSPLNELEMRWEGELKRRFAERAHLVAAEAAFTLVATGLPQLAPVVEEFKLENLRADRWVAADVASTFADILAEAVQTLRTWIGSAAIYGPDGRAAADALSRWFIGFVTEQALTIHVMGPRAPAEPVLERVLEVAHVVVNAHEPVTCVERLMEAGEMSRPSSAGPAPAAVIDDPAELEQVREEARPPEPLPVSTPAELSTELSDAVRREAWSEVVALGEANAASGLVDLARSLDAIGRGSPLEAADALPSAAAVLSTDGPACRLLATPRRVHLAFGLLAAAMQLDAAERLVPAKPDPDGSWSALLGRRQDFFRGLAAGGLSNRTLRVVESLTTGGIGGEVADKLWDAATNATDPQSMRAPLMRFFYDRGATEHILRFAARHEPQIRSRLEQLFDVRKVAGTRPDLIPVAQSLAEQVAEAARAGPFRAFVRSLPVAAEAVRPRLIVEVEQGLFLRAGRQGALELDVPVAIRPEGLVPEHISATLFSEDDVTFADGSRRLPLSDQPTYFATDHTIQLRFGPSWMQPSLENPRDSFRLRVGARTLTGDLVQEDALCPVVRFDRTGSGARTLDNDSLLQFYPGVGNTPARDDAFIGRFEEVEQLQRVLISAQKPSPVLLTGMRRIGKTSLLFRFHDAYRQPGGRQPGGSGAVTVYLSLAERRVALADPGQNVALTIFNTIVHALTKRNVTAADHNRDLVLRLVSAVEGDSQRLRQMLGDCRDPDSLSDSFIMLGERILQLIGPWARRVVFLIDEAEALIVPYQEGGTKRLELEQFLQSMREVSQTSENVGLLLSGSNHINVFAREYKNAFFGSCVRVDLEGIEAVDLSKQLIAPIRIDPFIQFDDAAVAYAVRTCAGMPQFMWQVGAATAFLVRSGPATRADIRRAVNTLVAGKPNTLPFLPYEVLEPLEHMLGLLPPRERDLQWMLLYRIANASSLVAEDAALPFILDQALLALDSREDWTGRLLSLVNLKILEMTRASSYRFRVPIFAEGFRAPKNWQEYNIRAQRAAA